MKVYIPTYRSCDEGCYCCEDIGFTTKELALEWSQEQFKPIMDEYRGGPNEEWMASNAPDEDDIQEIEIFEHLD